MLPDDSEIQQVEAIGVEFYVVIEKEVRNVVLTSAFSTQQCRSIRPRPHFVHSQRADSGRLAVRERVSY